MLNYHAEPRSEGSQRGSVFLLAIVILTVLLMLGSSLIENTQTSVYRATVQSRSAKSFHLAEAGIHKAIWELSQANGWTTYNGETASPLPGGHFDVAVSPAAPARLSDGSARITATGYLPGPNGSQRLSRQVQVVIGRNPPWPFGHAVAGNSSVDLGNASVDSYRSADGPYGGDNVRGNATVAVNATAFATDGKAVVSGVRVGSNGSLKGHVFVGAGCEDPPGATDIAGGFSGSIRPLKAPMMFDNPTIPDDAIDLGAIDLSGSETLTLTSGTYRASSLSITGATATLVVTGKVDLYVDGDILIAGNGIANQHPGKPRNLVIYGTENCTSVEIKGASTFYGAVYAPAASIIAQGSTQSGEIFGALVGSSVVLQGANTRFHYDESISLTAATTLQMRSWQEL